MTKEDKKEELALPKSLRYEVIENDELKDLLIKRGEVVTEARVVDGKREKLVQELKKLGHKMERYKDKSAPLLDLNEIKLEEFEVITEVKYEDGKLKVFISDRIEEYREAIRTQKKEALKKIEAEEKVKDIQDGCECEVNEECDNCKVDEK
tara:strand:+ start:874 stop:1326 length:453 start_codon:yes stop_codon:yes gene_type:complete